ncbi:CD300 molecule like family member f [Rhinolophus ferrumequinum]|uniref:CD300 molecule like family member f n=1 Tax=Rhinolophus ferrumequinum TaxID=59479 RepID=A0A7J7TCG0_RHIFE|nr:CMRF35-like molecule 1 isoform X2 [Rhinolophus ferrumequinum]KAF6298225.1 CD300 molecule like family member f [Rhinolophus ferrumequinum]
MYLLLLFRLLCLLSGSYSIQGPASVRGPEQGSLTVQCRYDPKWKNYVKWWCKGAVWSSCQILVKTTASEWEKDRVSIKDNQRSHIFTVTMKELRQDDADTYWCGIERSGVDLGVPVVVIIDPAEVTPENTTEAPTVTSHHSDGSGDSVKLNILLPIFFAVLLLLLVAASILAWRMVKRQKKAAGTSPEQVVQPLENDLCYANLTLTQTGTFPSSSRKEAFTESRPSAQEDQEEVGYVTMAPFPNEDICYATVSLDTSDQEPTYSNMDSLISDLPNRSLEGPTEYSSIRML